jgi:hypothetical protein
MMKDEGRKRAQFNLGAASSFNPKGIVSYSPGLAAPAAYPGKSCRRDLNPNGVVARLHCDKATTPLGLVPFVSSTQGSSFLATLGFEPESLWDSSDGFPEAIQKLRW